ncbi:retrotransposon protein, putative, ty1-copia subclass [Tanacetum coccineum]|uniref:Retrotransposon protein, putative, ty1-copia subclass n=1 Tax=Tanacetum coccineum TaxID=301880 RepID=A0ABQ5IC72_9ASTR
MSPRRSEDKESKYPFFEGVGSSSNEWGDYGMTGDEYEGPPVVFDDDQYEEESMPVYDTDIEDVIEEEEGFIEKDRFGGEEDNIEYIVVDPIDINKMTDTLEPEETGVGRLQLPGKDRVIFRPSERKSLLGVDVLASAKRVERSFKVPRPKVSSIMASMDKDVEKTSLADQDDVRSGVSSIGPNKSIKYRDSSGSKTCDSVGRIPFQEEVGLLTCLPSNKSKSHIVLGIAPAAIIDLQLPFEYTITSRSTDVVVMAHPVQNINHSAFRSMFEREKLSGNNFNGWFRQLKKFENYSPYEMLQELKSMFEKQARVERSTGTSWLCATTDLTLGLILNGLTKDFARFVRNYNMYNMGKTIGELHAMLIEYEKSLPKKVETPQVMMIKGGKIQKSKKKSLKAKGKGKAKGKRNDKQVYILKPKNPKPSSKEYATKDDTYHHCKEVGHWKRKFHVYLVELLKKKKQVGSACSSGNGVRAQVEDIGSYDLVLPNVLVICLDNCHYAPSITRGVASVHCLVETGFVSERTHRVLDRLCLNVEAEEHSLGDLNEPTSYKAAMLDSESNKWIDAMNTEIKSMMDNMVWVLVDLPPGCKTIRSKWIFKKKTDMDETFSPVADIRAIRILISIAAFYDYEIWQMDVKTAFLNGYLDEDIYMVQHEGFVDLNHPRKVCKLQRSIYGLKQASRSWNKRFDEEIKRFGFAQNLDEPCVYQKASGSNVTFLILLKRLIGLGQNAYMDKILKRYKMDNSKRGHILMQERLDLNKTQGASTPEEVKRMQNVPYTSAVDSITTCMTPTGNIDFRKSY